MGHYDHAEMCVKIRIKAYAFSYTALGKSGPDGAAMAQFVGFRFQVSGFGCQGVEVIDPET